MKVNGLPSGRLVVEMGGGAVRLSSPDQALDEAGALFRSFLPDDASAAGEMIAERRAESTTNRCRPA